MTTVAKLVASLAAAAALAIGTSAVLEKPSRTVTTTTYVEAHREEVWQAVIDFRRYDRWNPYMRVAGNPELGHDIDVVLDANGSSRRLHARIHVLDPPRKLRWQSRLVAPGLLDVEYEVIVAPVTPRLTRVVQRARDEGIVVLLAGAVPTREGLESMAAALEAHVEAGT